MSVVLITGCSSGIGLETALAFARNGDTVVATMRDVSKADALRSAADAEGLSVDLEVLDVRSDQSVASAVSAARNRHGQVDVLVNNAGIAPLSAFERMDQADIDAIWDTNLFGPMRMAKAVIPSMRAQGSGTILNVSSVAGHVPGPGTTMYSASKAALSAFSDGLAAELYSHGIRVAAIEPGFYATSILEKAISTLSDDDDNPYRDNERRVQMLFQQAAGDAEDPADVAKLLVETSGAESLDDLRIIAGASGRTFVTGRNNMSDRDWLDLNDAGSDEEYFALFAEAFPAID